MLFRHWEDAKPVKTYCIITDEIEPYEPGAFYKRELPCMANTLQEVEETITAPVVDGYVWLGENRGGPGYYLYETLKQTAHSFSP